MLDNEKIQIRVILFQTVLWIKGEMYDFNKQKYAQQGMKKAFPFLLCPKWRVGKGCGCKLFFWPKDNPKTLVCTYKFPAQMRNNATAL